MGLARRWPARATRPGAGYLVGRQQHRLGGPAIIGPNGTLEWFKNGKHHRVGGPAVVLAGGGEQWYVDGEPHRADGPAFIWPDGELEWWEDGEQKPPEVEAMLTMLWHARNPEDA